MKKTCYLILIITVLVFLVAGVRAGTTLGNDSNWTQSSKAEFETGTLFQLDTTGRPGSVQIARSENYIYAFRGNNTSSFWRYDIVTGLWSEMSEAPAKVETGGALAYVAGSYIYAFRGDDTGGFWRYDIATDEWSAMNDAPAGVSGGGALAGYGVDYIYALGGNDTKNFWRYDIASDNWTAMEDMPDEVEEGGALTGDGASYLYAFQGNNTEDFWRYDITADEWEAMADTPDRVGNGGALAYDGGSYIYAFRGNSTNSFWRYDIAADEWLETANAPHEVAYGSALACDGGSYIYALLGGDTQSFWRYDIAAASWAPAAWISMADAPAAVKDGGTLVYGNGSYIYAFRGNDTKKFWRYDITSDNWSAMNDAPAKVKEGGALIYDRNIYIYALQGNLSKSFWRYNISAGWWYLLTDAPAAVQEGGALTHDGSNYIYALRGNNTGDFWRYDIAANTWSLKADAPDKVKGGGALVYDDEGHIFAFRGNDTKSFWRYDIATDTWAEMADAPYKVNEGGDLTYDGADAIYALRGNDSKSYWRYDIFTNSWSVLSGTPGDVEGGGSLVSDRSSNIYAFQGNDSNSFWRYDADADAWMSTAWTPVADTPGSVEEGGAIAYQGAYYLPSGKLVSPIHDTGVDQVNWGNMTWNETLNGQTINMRIRTSGNVDMNGAPSWDSCPIITNGQDISSLSSVTDGHRYIQYYCKLSTSDASQTPILHDVTITYVANRPPVINEVGLYDSTRLMPAGSMDPQIEYAIKVKITDDNQLSDLKRVRVTLFYDADGIYRTDEIPTSGNCQTSAILTCNVGTAPGWSIDAGGTTWTIESASCTQPDLNNTSGDFWFHFKPGKVATETTGNAGWHIYAVADDGSAAGTGHQDNRDMNWYGEVVTNTGSIEWGEINSSADFNDAARITGIPVIYITNGAYQKQAAASRLWTGTGGTMALNTAGAPLTNEFSLKFNANADLGEARLVTASPTYTTIDDKSIQTDETGDKTTTNTLWLKQGSLSNHEAPSGTFYFRITR